jgi:CDGSH-type Zn-finger protein
MKQGDIAIVVDQDIIGEVVLVENKMVTLKLSDGQNIIKQEEDLKRKKKCVCGMSKKFPACDGSHSGN